jgi:hypothetical protein
MAYQNTTAEIRPELTSVLEEALALDNYLIGLDILPVFQVDRSSGEYRKLTMTASELAKAGDKERGPKSPYPEVDWTWEKDNYKTVDRGLTQKIDDSIANDVVQAFDLESQASKQLLRRIRLSHEQRVAAKIFNTSNFDAVNSTVAYTSVNKATMDFAEDVHAALNRIRARGESPNTMVLSRPVWDRVRTSDLLAKYFFGALGGGQQITLEMLAKNFQVGSVRIADAVVDTADKGQTAAMSYVWANTHVWIGEVQGGDFSVGGAGRTLVWTGDTGGAPFVTETYRDENVRSDVIRVRSNLDEKIVNARAGTLITTQFA